MNHVSKPLAGCDCRNSTSGHFSLHDKSIIKVSIATYHIHILSRTTPPHCIFPLGLSQRDDVMCAKEILHRSKAHYAATDYNALAIYGLERVFVIRNVSSEIVLKTNTHTQTQHAHPSCLFTMALCCSFTTFCPFPVRIKSCTTKLQAMFIGGASSKCVHSVFFKHVCGDRLPYSGEHIRI